MNQPPDRPPRPRPQRSALLERRISELAFEMPELAELSQADLDAISRAVAADELKAELRRAVIARRIDWDTERAAFLADCRSEHTRRAYRRALDAYAAWLTRSARSFTDVHAREADDFIRDLRSDQAHDADSIRLVVAAVSAFSTFLERRYDEMQNPFRGSKARPAATWTESRIPTADEIGRIMAKADLLTAAAVAIVSETGLRIGALPALLIKPDGTYATVTKGKQFVGPEALPRDALAMIAAAGLDERRPFDPSRHVPRSPKAGAVDVASSEERVIALLKTRLARACDRLAAGGLIRERYSFHDLRHAYAEAHADRGLRWLARRLGHASIAITERYLRNRLGIETEGL